MLEVHGSNLDRATGNCVSSSWVSGWTLASNFKWGTAALSPAVTCSPLISLHSLFSSRDNPHRTMPKFVVSWVRIYCDQELKPRELQKCFVEVSGGKNSFRNTTSTDILCKTRNLIKVAELMHLQYKSHDLTRCQFISRTKQLLCCEVYNCFGFFVYGAF